MLTYPDIDAVAFSLGPITIGDKVLGPLEVHWYGIMYLLAFITAGTIAWWRSKRPASPVKTAEIEDLVVYGALGVIVGGRCGYILFYHFERWLQDPLWLFRVWEGGMSFHGGLLGVIVAMALYARKLKQPFMAVTDFIAPMVPLGLGFGRLGNFIGQELWGRATDLPWGMVFPNDPAQLPRHPSQLYQACLEGLALFLIVFWFSAKPRPRGAVSGLFLLCYGVFRFLVEFVRQPDSHLQSALVFGWMTRGQLLSLPMVALGIGLVVWAYRSQQQSAATPLQDKSGE